MMRAFLPVLGLFLIQQVFSQHADMLSDEGWELEKSKYEIEVYGKLLEGYEIKAFKATGLIEGSVAAVTEVIMDIEGYKDWYPNCKEGEVLEGSTPSDQYRRVEFKLPWPFDNRDVVNRLTVDERGDDVWIEIINASDYHEELKNVFRVKRAEGYWHIIKESEHETCLLYTSDAADD